MNNDNDNSNNESRMSRIILPRQSLRWPRRRSLMEVAAGEPRPPSSTSRRCGPSRAVPPGPERPRHPWRDCPLRGRPPPGPHRFHQPEVVGGARPGGQFTGEGFRQVEEKPWGRGPGRGGGRAAAGADNIAASVLARYRPYEPEMVLQFFGARFRQWRVTRRSRGKTDFIVPWPDKPGGAPALEDPAPRARWKEIRNCSRGAPPREQFLILFSDNCFRSTQGTTFDKNVLFKPILF